VRAFAQTLITAALLSTPVGGSHAQTDWRGADVEKLVKEVYGTSKETAAEAAAMIR